MATLDHSMSIMPALQTLHLIFFTALGGGLLLNESRWIRHSIFGMLMTGTPMAWVEWEKVQSHPVFQLKMGLLVLALLIQFYLRPRLKDPRIGSALSVAVWFSVAASGRWIGFS